MCFECRKQQIDRRRFITGFGLGAAALALPPGLGRAAAGSRLGPEEALARLKAGNERFVEDADACAVQLARRRIETSAGQAPWATILTCSDSRVTPELIFGGVSLGDLFVVRNAGNVLETNGLGTIEYGAEHLHSPIVVVMGHKKCGAVAAACNAAANGTSYDASVGKMIQPIIPVALAERGKAGDLVDNTVRANAVRGAERIVAESSIVAHLAETGAIRVVPAYYDLDTGHVDFLETG